MVRIKRVTTDLLFISCKPHPSQMTWEPSSFDRWESQVSRRLRNLPKQWNWEGVETGFKTRILEPQCTYCLSNSKIPFPGDAHLTSSKPLCQHSSPGYVCCSRTIISLLFQTFRLETSPPPGREVTPNFFWVHILVFSMRKWGAERDVVSSRQA